MAHTIEPASSGRARCRGCNQRIARDQLRLGERLPNPFGEGEMTLWFHLACAAYKRPQPLIEALETAATSIERRDWLRSQAEQGLAHRRLPRVEGAQRAPTGRARCRCCREMIDKGAWRLQLVYYEEGRFQPSGFVHARCSRPYLETVDIIDRVRHFCPSLTEQDLEELGSELSRGEEGSDDA